MGNYGDIGEFVYNEQRSRFVAPPNAKFQALGKKREADYVQTKNDVNALQTMMRALPKDTDPELYNEILAKQNQVLSGVNADNYADKVLDIDQYSYDFVNKDGASELMQKQKQIGDAYKVYDDAYEKGEIEDPAKAEWHKQRIMAEAKANPLKRDVNGFISKPNIKPHAFVPYVNGQELVDKTLKGWEADGSVVLDPKTGKYKVSDEVRGYLGITDRESISEAELLQAGIKTLQNDGKYQSYLKEDAQFKTRNIEPNAENVNAILSVNVKKGLFGTDKPTNEQIQESINNGSLNPVYAIQEAFKNEEMISKSVVPAAKYGYTKDKLTLYKDELLLGALKAQQETYKAQAKQQAESNVVVTVEPFTSQQIINPTNIKALETNKQNLIEQRKNLQITLRANQQAYNKGNSNITLEKLEDNNKQVTLLDRQIEEHEQQQKSLSKALPDSAKKLGINLIDGKDSVYDKSYKPSYDIVKKKNLETLKSMDFEVDLTADIKTDKNGVKYIDDPEYTSGKRIVYDPSVKTNPAYSSTDTGLQRVGDKYILKVKGSSGTIPTLMTSYFLKNDGTLKNNVTLNNQDDKSRLYKVPDREEFGKMALQGYIDDETSSSFDVPYTYENTGKNYKLMHTSAFLDDIQKVKDSQGTIGLPLVQSLSDIMVTGATVKDAEMSYVNFEKSKNKSFRDTPSQYSIETVDGVTPLGDYLKDKFGIPAIDGRYIDWKASDIKTLIQTSREYGQKNGINIVLTPYGKTFLDKETGADETYARERQIKLVGVNTIKDTREEQNALKNILFKSYAGQAGDGSDHATDMKKQMGIIYANNSPEGQDLNSKNLYTMSAGDVKHWDVRGTDYQITTTSRDAQQSDIMNVDFHLATVQNGQQVTLAKSESTGITSWVPTKDLDANKDMARVIFESPEDIKAVVGAKLLDEDFKVNKATVTRNAFAEYLQVNTGYKSTNSGSVIETYQSILTRNKSYYDAENTISILNNKGEKKTFVSRVPQEDLVDLRQTAPGNIDTNVQYPYVNKDVAPNVNKFIEDTNAKVTGGFRGNSTHNLAKAGENSLHKYGYSLDFGYTDELFTNVNNPEFLKEHGIVKFEKHENPLHLHIEFAPNNP
jgi:hypothetical protein